MSSPRLPIDTVGLARVCRRFRVKRLALFGSVLRDDFGPSSDVDVLVEFDPESRPTLLTLEALRIELAELFAGRSVDLVTPGGLHPMLRDEILAEAREAYAA